MRILGNIENNQKLLSTLFCCLLDSVIFGSFRVCYHAHLFTLLVDFLGHLMARFLVSILFACCLVCPVEAGQSAPDGQQLDSSSHNADFRQAKEMLQHGAMDEALAAAQTGLKRSPHSVDGLNLLGMILHQLKRYGESEDVLQKALKINSRSTATLNNLAINFISQEKFDQAERTFREILRMAPQDRSANYNLGLLLLSQKKPKEAILALQRVRPADSSVLLNLVQAQLMAGLTAQALSTAETLSRQNAKDVKLHFTLGVVLASKNAYKSAIHEFELANALQPRTIEILHDLGQAYLRNGQFSKAEATLEQGLELDRNSAETLYLLAQCLADQNKDIEALELLVRARKLAPENTNVILLMARLSMKQQFYEDAIVLLQEGIKLDAARAELHAALGESYFTVGKVDEAVEEFKLLLQLDHSARSYTYMGLCQRHLGKLDDARDYLNQGLKLDPHDSVILFNLGVIARKQQEQAQAEQYLRRALKINPAYAEVLFELGGLLMDERRYAEAILPLRRSAELSQKPAQAYYKLATAERNLHQMDAAERDMKVFLTLSKNPDPGPYPLQNFFEQVGQRGELSAVQRKEAEVGELEAEAKQHPDSPRSLYQLAEAYLKVNRVDDAKQTILQLDRLSGGDFRTLLGEGVLLARFRLYPEAIQHFEAAIAANPASDEAYYNLANARFQTGEYTKALESLKQVSAESQKDGAFLALAGDIYGRMGRTSEAIQNLRRAYVASPGNDQYCFSLALAELRSGNTEAARETLRRGLTRVPDSGILYWGLGIASVLQNDPNQAEASLKKAIDLSPSREGILMTLGIFYYEAGQIENAKQVLQRYAELFPEGSMNVDKMRATLDAAAVEKKSSPKLTGLSADARREFYELAANLALESR
jgi:tetratricopeptide (TPR) repeat protein